MFMLYFWRKIRADIYSAKISALIEEEDALNEKVVIARIKCDNLKAHYHCVVGERERRN